MLSHTPNIYFADLPFFFIAEVLEKLSGIFERKMAITAAVLTAPPAIILTRSLLIPEFHPLMILKR